MAKPKTGGRQKGTLNKDKQAMLDEIKSGGITPLEYMLSVMRQEIPKDASSDQKSLIKGQKMDAASKAAPYVHPKLVATHITAEETPQTLEDWIDNLHDEDTESDSAEE